MEYADVQKMDINTISLDDFPRLVLKEASFLIRGHGSIQMLQMFLDDYIRMEKEKSKKIFDQEESVDAVVFTDSFVF